MFLVGLSFVLIYVFDVGQVGYLVDSKDGQTSVSAGCNPAILVWDALAVALFVTLMLRKPNTVVPGIPSRGRRILAFLIDFWFSLLALSGVVALLPLWLEAVRTAHFAWHFQRDYGVPTDDLFAFPAVLATMVLLVLYFVFPLTRGRQTVGCFIVRIQVTPPFGDGGRFTFKEALRRIYHEFTGLSPFRKWDRDALGRTRWDRQTNCNVVLVGDD
jgi:hypothetical protein